MPEVTLKEGTLDGKRIGYHSFTRFLVQTSRTKNPKSGYVTRNTVVGNLTQAVLLYNGYNIGLGYKKRLVMEGGTPPVLARATS